MSDGRWLKDDGRDLKIQLVTRLKKSLSAVVRTRIKLIFKNFKVTQISQIAQKYLECQGTGQWHLLKLTR